MDNESFFDNGWSMIVAALGGSDEIDRLARESGAFTRARQVKNADDLLRLCFAYGPGGKSLRVSAAWAEAIGLCSLSDVGLLERLRRCPDWLSSLISHKIQIDTPPEVRGRLIRLVDGSTVRKAGKEQGAWRIHAVYDVVERRFSFLELSDEKTGERLDMAPVVPGEIRIGDRAYMSADRIGRLLEARGDVLVRASWNHGRWLDDDGRKLDLISLLKAADKRGEMVLDRPILVGRNAKKTPLKLRLVAIKKPPEAIEKALQTAHKIAQKKQYKISQETLESAKWLILITSLPEADFSVDVLSKLYRCRWQIELAFKRLKSLIGTKKPPGKDEKLAKTFLLSHLLLAVIMEPSVEKLRDSFP